MPRGRFISKDICLDKQVNDLSSAESKLAFTWLIPHLDKEGRTYGDPAVVRAMIFPRRTDISIEQMELFIQEWHNAGLIIWYEYEDDKYILFPNFGKHQVGLNKKREADSVIPMPDELTNYSGVNPDQIPVNVKLSKVNDKLSEGKTDRQTFINKFISIVRVDFTNHKQPQKLDDLVEDYGEELILEVAQWCQDKQMTSMGNVLSAMESALKRGWSSSKKGKKQQMLDVLEGMKEE